MQIKTIQEKKITGNIPFKYICKSPDQKVASQIQQHIKKILHHKQMGFILGWFNNVNHNVIYYIWIKISIHAKKALKY